MEKTNIVSLLFCLRKAKIVQSPFVKQNNFDKKATLFVETHRSIGNSIIYDYKIDHQDGSILKVFMTGETLSESGRNNLYAYAKEHGIREDQIIVKEYTTKQVQNNDEVFKGIYEKLDSQIDEYEKTIENLKAELLLAKKSELPYTQLANEISANYPEIKHIYIGQGAGVNIESQEITSCVIVKVKTDSLMQESSLQQLKKWIKIRLQVETIEIDNTVN